MRTACCALAICCLPTAAIADHDSRPANWIGDTLLTSRTLTAASPGPVYVLYGDLTIPAGVTLTVQPGVTVRAFHETDFFYAGDPRRAEIFVHGSLVAGSESGPVARFISELPTAQSWGGLRIELGGTATLVNCQIASASAAIRSNGTTGVRRCAIEGSVVGIEAYQGSLTLLASSIYGMTGPGLSYGSGVQPYTTPPDTLLPTPTVISNCAIGVKGTGGDLRNLLIHACELGVFSEHTTTQRMRLNYCTLASNSMAVRHDAPMAIDIWNSILSNHAQVQSGGLAQLRHTDLWLGTIPFGQIQMTGPVAFYNPMFLDEAHHLASTSLFLDFSVSGGEIGAHGPGGGGPTNIAAAEHLSSTVRLGAIALEWAVHGGTSATVFRRTSVKDDWTALERVPVQGEGRVRFEDTGVEPGKRYAYGLGIRHEGTVAIQGEVWVEAPPAETALISTRWTGSSLDVRFALSGLPGSRVEIFDAAGRRLHVQSVAEMGPGTHTSTIALADAQPTVCFVRLTEGSRSTTRKALIGSP